jgi:hypothetical protein
MKTKLTAAAIILAVLIFAGWTLRPAAQVWEYKVVTLKDNNQPEKSQAAISALGSEGWELVSVTRGSYNGSTFDSAAYYFERSKQ